MMKGLIGLGVFGTFGEPHGFQQAFYHDAHFTQSLDLNTNAIEVYPNTVLYAFRRELIDDIFRLCFCKYTYAKELNSNRGGTFIGTCVVIQDGHLKADTAFNILNELHRDVIENNKNIFNDTLQVTEAQHLEVKEPTRYQEAKNAVFTSNIIHIRSEEIDKSKKFLIIPNNSSQVIESDIVKFFDKALKEFKDVDTFYFTFSKDIIDYVHKKGLLECATWDDFMGNHQEQRASTTNHKKTKKQKGKKHIKLIQNPNPNSYSFEPWNEPKGSWNYNEILNKVNEHNSLLELTIELQDRLKAFERKQQNGNMNSNRARESSNAISLNDKAIASIIAVAFLVVIALGLLIF